MLERVKQRVIGPWREEARRAQMQEAAFRRIEEYARERGIEVEREGALVIAKDIDRLPIGMATRRGQALVLEFKLLEEER